MTNPLRKPAAGIDRAVAALLLTIVSWQVTSPQPARLAANQAAEVIDPAGSVLEPSEPMIPLTDMGQMTYFRFPGGLYPGASNEMPSRHMRIGRARANAVQPLDVNGNPDLEGKYVLLSIGMSNTTQEFCSREATPPCTAWSFVGQAAADPEVISSNLVIVNGARGGQTAGDWESPDHSNYDRIRETWLAPQGLSERQVQVAWVKVANPRPTRSLPAADADAYELERRMGNIVRSMKIRYPNLRLIFLSSRIYAGYASSPLNPEPYAYESAFAVKWLIEAQIRQMNGRPADKRAGNLDYNDAAPWLGWGPYLWANGTSPRSDGLIWERGDFQSDGTHPARDGEEKVGRLLLTFFKTSTFASDWFVDAGEPTPIGRSGDERPGSSQVDRLQLKNYPDPFTIRTTIRYIIPEQTHVRLEIFDAVGRRVELLVDRQQPAGLHELVFDAKELPSGKYYSRLNAGFKIRIDQVTIVR